MAEDLITDEELATEGAIFYTTRYADGAGNEMYLTYRDVLCRTPEDAIRVAMGYILETVVVGLHRIGTDPVISKQTVVAIPMQLWAGPISLDVTVLKGPAFDELKEEGLKMVEEQWQARKQSNRDSHKNIESVGEGELAYCRDCKGGEIQLWEQSCAVRQSMNLLGLE